MKKLFFLILLTLFVSNVNATARWHTAIVQTVYPHSNGDFVIIFDKDSSYCSNSATGNKYYYVSAGQNRVNRKGVKSMLSTALTAATTKNRLSINFDDATEKCFVNRMKLSFE